MDDPYDLIVLPKVDALAFLQSIYNDPSEPKSLRTRAAIEALPFEKPKLAVTALVNGEAFGEALERAIKRSGKVIEAEAIRAIEAEPALGQAKRFARQGSVKRL